MSESEQYDPLVWRLVSALQYCRRDYIVALEAMQMTPLVAGETTTERSVKEGGIRQTLSLIDYALNEAAIAHFPTPNMSETE